MWFAVWLGWQYTSSVTNWFNMLLALVPVALVADLLVMGWLTTVVVLVVSFWEANLLRGRRRKVAR